MKALHNGRIVKVVKKRTNLQPLTSSKYWARLIQYANSLFFLRCSCSPYQCVCVCVCLCAHMCIFCQQYAIALNASLEGSRTYSYDSVKQWHRSHERLSGEITFSQNTKYISNSSFRCWNLLLRNAGSRATPTGACCSAVPWTDSGIMDSLRGKFLCHFQAFNSFGQASKFCSAK